MHHVETSFSIALIEYNYAVYDVLFFPHGLIPMEIHLFIETYKCIIPLLLDNVQSNF